MLTRGKARRGLRPPVFRTDGGGYHKKIDRGQLLDVIFEKAAPHLSWWFSVRADLMVKGEGASWRTVAGRRSGDAAQGFRLGVKLRHGVANRKMSTLPMASEDTRAIRANSMFSKPLPFLVGTGGRGPGPKPPRRRVPLPDRHFTKNTLHEMGGGVGHDVSLTAGA